MYSNLEPHRQKKNYNEKQDFTKEKKERLVRGNNIAARFIAFLMTFLYGFLHAFRHNEFHDDRCQGKVEYTASEMWVSNIMSYSCNMITGREYNRNAHSKQFADNIAFICGKFGLKTAPDRKTLNDFFTKNANPDDIRDINYSVIGWLVNNNEKLPDHIQQYLGKVAGTINIGGKVYPIIIDATTMACIVNEPGKFANCVHSKSKQKDADGNDIYIYYVSALVACIVFSENDVCELDHEFIMNEDENPVKQDCEVNACRRLITRLLKYFPTAQFLLNGDALYFNYPFLKFCHENGLLLQATLKSGNSKHVCDTFEKLKTVDPKLGGCESMEVETEPNRTARITWADNVNVQCQKEYPSDAERYSVPFGVLELVYEVHIINGQKKNAVPLKRLVGRHYHVQELSDNPDCNYNGAKNSGSNKRKTAVSNADGSDEVTIEDISELTDEDAKTAVQVVNSLNNGTDSESPVFNGQVSKRKECDVHVGEFTDKEGQHVKVVQVVWMWGVTCELTKDNVVEATFLGRGRWNIEEKFYFRKYVMFDISHLRSYDPQGWECNYWSISVADTCTQMFFNYDPLISHMHLTRPESAQKLFHSLQTEQLNNGLIISIKEENEKIFAGEPDAEVVFPDLAGTIKKEEDNHSDIDQEKSNNSDTDKGGSNSSNIDSDESNADNEKSDTESNRDNNKQPAEQLNIEYNSDNNSGPDTVGHVNEDSTDDSNERGGAYLKGEINSSLLQIKRKNKLKAKDRYKKRKVRKSRDNCDRYIDDRPSECFSPLIADQKVPDAIKYSFYEPNKCIIGRVDSEIIIAAIYLALLYIAFLSLQCNYNILSRHRLVLEERNIPAHSICAN